MFMDLIGFLNEFIGDLIGRKIDFYVNLGFN
jgi:hypothetical protein